MYYNEFFENTGECETSFFLGCRDCKNCRVELYNREVEEELRKRNEREQKFLKEMYEDEFEFDEDYDSYWVQRELEELQATQYEINMLRKALRGLEKVDIIETAMTVVNRQIKEKMEEINNNSIHDKTLIDTYKSFFKINLESMTEEEIDCIDLTVYTDCQPW